MKAKQDKVRLLCISGVVAAIIYIFTAFFHIPSHTGYTHVGDAFVYLAGSVLPAPYAMCAGAVGGVLADVLGGYALWAPGTGIIKALTALCFSRKGSTILPPRNRWAIAPAFVLCVGGYYVYEALLYGNWVSPLAAIPGNLLQSAASTALYVALALAIDKAKGKSKLLGES
jgi:uncharacterized repeat protein (TIGR04002 family)